MAVVHVAIGAADWVEHDLACGDGGGRRDEEGVGWWVVPGGRSNAGLGGARCRRAGRESARADPTLGDRYSPLSGHSNSDVSSASLKPPLEPPSADGPSPPPLSFGFFGAGLGGGAARRAAGNGGGFATFFLIALASGLSSDDIATWDGGRSQAALVLSPRSYHKSGRSLFFACSFRDRWSQLPNGTLATFCKLIKPDLSRLVLSNSAKSTCKRGQGRPSEAKYNPSEAK